MTGSLYVARGVRGSTESVNSARLPMDGSAHYPAGVPATTPYLAVDLARVRRNLRRVAERAAASGVTLRPHVKTHKSPELAWLQLQAGAVGVTVATIGETEVFARHRLDDILIAYPLWVDRRAAERLKDLMTRARVIVGVDSVPGAAALGRFLGHTPLEVLVEVDSGHHRTGCPPEEAGEVAAAAQRAGMDVRGAFTFPGHSYSPDTVTSAAEDERRALTATADSLRAAGVEPRVLSGGSTPSLEASLDDPGPLTELRPGVYAVGDAQQWELGTMAPEELALTCRTTVVSNAGGRAVVDAGSKILGADRAPYSSGFGRVPEREEARIVMLSEHHAVIDWAGTPPPPGTVVDVVPNHACNAVNLVDTLYVDHAGDVREWPVAARGHNS